MSDSGERAQAEERTRRLEAQLAAVTARVYQLEREVSALSGSPLPAAAREAPATQAGSPEWSAGPVHDLPGETTEAVTSTAAAPPPVPAFPAAPVSAAKAARAPRDERSLESRVGSQWFNRIGIVAILVGVAWFLKFAFDNHWVGPLGRVLIGLLSGGALIGWSERFRSKGYSGFSYSLKAVGSGVLYLSLWAAFSLYHLISPGMGFAGMILVTAFTAFVAWRQDAELLAVYAIVGAFSTPLLLSTGRNDEVFLFSYLLIMNAATMALLVLKGWNRLLVLSFIGTAAFYTGWYAQFYTASAFTTTAIFLSLFVLLFAAATILARQKRVHAAQDDAVRVLVSLANAALGFLGFYVMLSGNGNGRNTALAWCAVGFGAFYLGVRKAMERTPITGGRLASLSDVQLSIAIVFLTLAVPLAVHGHWVTIGWMAEGAVLVWLATRMRTLLMQVLAAGALALGLISLSMDATIGQFQVFWNTRLLSFAVSIAAMAISAWLAQREATRVPSVSSAAAWGVMTQVGAATTHLLVVIAVLLEIHTFWWHGYRPSAQGTYSLEPNVYSLLNSNTLLSDAMWLMIAGAATQWVAARRPARLRSSAILRWETVILLVAGVLVLLSSVGYSRQTVLLNLRFAAFLVSIAALGWAAWGQWRSGVAARSRNWQYAPLGMALLANLLAISAVCFEIATYWGTRPLAAAAGSQVYYSLLADRRMAERFSYSAWFLLAGALLLVVGFRRRSALLRWQGLVLLAVTIFKVFLLDTSTLGQGYRIISFLALGALLLGVSFAYQRDWLHLRAAGDADGGNAQ